MITAATNKLRFPLIVYIAACPGTFCASQVTIDELMCHSRRNDERLSGKLDNEPG